MVNELNPESKGGTAEETVKIIREAGGEAMAVYGDISQIDVCQRLMWRADKASTLPQPR